MLKYFSLLFTLFELCGPVLNTNSKVHLRKKKSGKDFQPLCLGYSNLLFICSPVPLSLAVGVAFAVLSDVLSAPRFLVDVFSFVVHAEFQVGVLVPEEFRWKILLGEELQPLVVLLLCVICMGNCS